jgi:hypothetical protein
MPESIVQKIWSRGGLFQGHSTGLQPSRCCDGVPGPHNSSGSLSSHMQLLVYQAKPD